MYLTIDLQEPIKNAYLANSRMRATILKYWPKGGTRFNRCYYYINGSVVNTPGMRKIYSIVGTSYYELNEQDYEGLENAWFELKSYRRSSPTYNNALVEDYIRDQSTLDQEYVVPLVYTQQASVNALVDLQALTNEQIETMVEGGYTSAYPSTIISNEASGKEITIEVFKSLMMSYDLNVSNVTFAAIYDTANTLFTSTTKVISRDMVPVYNKDRTAIVKYTMKVGLEYRFTRIKDPSDVSCVDLITLLKTEAQKPEDGRYSLTQQLITMNDSIDPVSNNELFYDGGIRVDGATDLKTKEFVAMFAKAFKTDYKVEEQDSNFFMEVIGWVIVIIIIYFSWGAGLKAAAAYSGLYAAAAFLGTFSMGLAIGSLVMTAIVMVVGDKYGIAIAFKNSMVFLNTLSTITGFMAVIAGVAAAASKAAGAISEATRTAGATAVQEAVKPTLIEAATDYLVDAAKDYVSNMFSNMSTGEVLTKAVRGLNMAFDYYVKHVAPIQNPGEPQEEAIIDNIETVRLTQANFETYGFIDLNEVMNNMPYNMTQGNVDRTVSKYYQG